MDIISRDLVIEQSFFSCFVLSSFEFFIYKETMSTTVSHLITIAATLLQAQNDPTPAPC